MNNLIFDNNGNYYDNKSYAQWELENGKIIDKIKGQRCINCDKKWNESNKIMFAKFKDGQLVWWHRPKYHIR